MKLMQNKFVPAFLLFCAAYALAYIPGESGFVSLENEHGIWGNPAGLAAFDSKGALVSYDYDNAIKNFRIGGNLEHWAASFDYTQGPNRLDISRWSLTHGNALWNRVIFVGERLNATRTAHYSGTEWSLDLGLMLRPLSFLSLGYSCDNALYVGPQAPERVQNLGATLRLGPLMSVSYDVEDFENHRLLIELGLYGVRWGLRVPLHGDDQYRLTFSTSLGGYNNVALHVYDDLLPKGGAWGYHSARNPNASLSAQIIRVPLDMQVSETEDEYSFFRKSSISIWHVRNLFEHMLRDPACGLVILDFSGYKGNIGDGRGYLPGEIGTIKTLNRDDESFHKMAVLMADFQMKATRFINQHLDDFTWTGYDADFFLEGHEGKAYGYTDKRSKTIDEAVRKAVKYLNSDHPSGYDEVIITENKSGNELHISKKSIQRHPFDLKAELDLEQK